MWSIDTVKSLSVCVLHWRGEATGVPSTEGGNFSAVITFVLENRDIDYDGDNKAV